MRTSPGPGAGGSGCRNEFGPMLANSLFAAPPPAPHPHPIPIPFGSPWALALSCRLVVLAFVVWRGSLGAGGRVAFRAALGGLCDLEAVRTVNTCFQLLITNGSANCDFLGDCVADLGNRC